MSAEGSSEESRESQVPSTHRKLVSQELPLKWRARLFDASCSNAAEASPEQAVSAIVVAVAGVLPEATIGVRFSSGSEGQTIVCIPPRDVSSLSTDEARMFPELEHEHVVTIAADLGATLHFAVSETSIMSSPSFVEDFVAPLERALGAAIVRTRAYEQARRERRELEAQLVQIGKLASLGQMAAEIVHELNNPLTSIVAYSDFLHGKAQRAGADAADIERLARIKEAAARILSFSRDIVTYARPSSGSAGPVLIHEVIERALGFCDHVLSEMHVEVLREFGDVGEIVGVSVELTQVFVNLFTNAAHAMREQGGCLSIETAVVSNGERARIVIRDEGHGIAEANLEKIFEPYFTTKPEGIGSGLGLSIVRNIIVSHGGTIRARANDARGAVFEIELPLASTSA